MFFKVGSDIVATSPSDVYNIEVLTVELNSVIVTSMYKKPTADFNFSQPVPLKDDDKPLLIIGTLTATATNGVQG